MRSITLACLLVLSFQSAAASLTDAIELYRSGQYTLAEQAFKELDKVEAYTYLARLAAPEDLDKAEDYIEQAIEGDANNAEAHYHCGIIMSRQASDAFLSALSYANRSLDCFQRAAELDSSSLKYRRGLLNFYHQAPSIAGGDDDKAREQAAAIEAINWAEGQLAHLRIMNEEKRDNALTQLLEQHPQVADFHLYAALRAQDAANYEAAFHHLEQALAQSNSGPNDLYKQALYQVGRTAVLSQQQVQRGIQALENYIKQGPHSTPLPEPHWAYWRLSQLYRLKGSTDKAEALAQHWQHVTDPAFVKR